MGIDFHPLANLFPLIERAEFDALVADVKANGLREKIVIHDGKILDGRNRYRAALAAGLFEDEFDGRSGQYFANWNEAHGDPLKWVLSKNLHRRHLSESQRAMIASRIATLSVGRPSEWKGGDGKSSNLSNLSDVKQDDAAYMLNVSRSSVQTAGRVREHGAPELVDAVERGTVAVSAAAEVAKLPIGEQLEILRGADPKAFARVAKERRAETQGGKRESRDSREAALAARQVALPDKRFGVILADPEWRFEPYSRETGMDRAADNHYPTSSLEAIKARPVSDIAAPDAVLFLWATSPMLPQALEVMAAWGFAYKSHIIWRKADAKPSKRDGHGALVLGTGYWFRNGHELLLVGTRGSVPAPAPGTQLPSMLDAAPRRHSEKPEIFLEMIEAYFPTLPKIELNRRGPPRAGWDAWGNETEESTAARKDVHPIPSADSSADSRPREAEKPIDADMHPQREARPEEGAGTQAPPVETTKPAPNYSDPIPTIISETSIEVEKISAGSDLNQIIREGYARDASIEELMRLTGLKRSAVKMRAKRMKLSDPERQRKAARVLMQARHDARAGA